MIKSTIKSNIKSYRQGLIKHQKQVDYAASRAINDTTGECRKAIIKKVQSKQKSKKAWWNNKIYGIRRRFADKRHLIGSVFTNIWWGMLQEEGGIKRKKIHKMTVPTTNMAKTYRKSGGTRKLMQQKTVFVNKNTIFRKVGGKKSRQVKRLGSLVDQVRILKPILSFRATARRIAKRSFARNFRKRMKEALKTAR